MIQGRDPGDEHVSYYTATELIEDLGIQRGTLYDLLERVDVETRYRKNKGTRQVRVFSEADAAKLRQLLAEIDAGR